MYYQTILFRNTITPLLSVYHNKTIVVIIPQYGKVTEYGQCPNTDTIGISETINPTKKIVMNNIFISI